MPRIVRRPCLRIVRRHAQDSEEALPAQEGLHQFKVPLPAAASGRNNLCWECRLCIAVQCSAVQAVHSQH
jgi:hypothetical protein